MIRRTFLSLTVLAVTLAFPEWALSQDPPKADPPPTLHTVAILPFQERGREVEELGGKISDLLLKDLLLDPELYVVERQDLKKILEEQELGVAGLADPQSAAAVGRLTGAKVLINGSVFQLTDTLYVVVKLVGTENGRVLAASVKGNATGDLDALVEQLSRKVIAELRKEGSDLIPAPILQADRIAAIRKKLGDTPRPTVWIDVTERHVGQPAIDPAAATELAYYCTELGFQVIDRQQGSKNDATILLVGEGFSQFASKHGNLVSVKARLELKAVDRVTGRVLAVDRQSTVVADAAELIASKSALQEATARIATRLLPAMLKPQAK